MPLLNTQQNVARISVFSLKNTVENEQFNTFHILQHNFLKDQRFDEVGKERNAQGNII